MLCVKIMWDEVVRKSLRTRLMGRTRWMGRTRCMGRTRLMGRTRRMGRTRWMQKVQVAKTWDLKKSIIFPLHGV